MSDLPDSWLVLQLGEVLDYGKTEKIEPNEIDPETWVLELEDIESGTSRLMHRPTFKERQSKSTKNRFSAGDVLYGKLRPYLNKVVIANDDGCCTTEIIPLKPNEAIFGRYLFYWLKHPVFLDYVTSVSHGLNMPRLGTEAGLHAPIVLAPYNEQRRIADKLDVLLDQVDACRQKLDRASAYLKQLRQAVLDAATSGQLTEDWRDALHIEPPVRTVLGQVVTETSYGTSAKSDAVGNVPVLRMGNIQGGRLDWTNLVYTSDPDEIAKYTLHPGDVLFNRTNSPELVGKTAVYRGEQAAIYAGYLIRVRCSEQLLPDYLNYCLNSPEGRDWCWRVKSDGVSQSNINARKLTDFEFLLPSVTEQTEIIRRVDILFTFADYLATRHRVAYAELERLTPAILAKAFRGELVPQDPNDEPASALLERINAAKQTDEQKSQTTVKIRRPIPMKRDRATVMQTVDQLPQSKARFSQLHAQMPGDYDELKEIVFGLLAETPTLLAEVDGRLSQVFDPEQGALFLQRDAQ